MKNSLLINYFLVNLVFSRGISMCVLKMYYVRLYIVEKWGLEWFLDDMRFIPNLNHYCRKLTLFFFNVFETLVVYAGEYLRTHALAHVRRLLPTYVG